MIPATDQAVEWQRISPLSVFFFITSFLRKIIAQALPALIVMIAGLSSADVVQLDWIIRGLILLVALGLGVSVMTYLRFRYRIGSDRIILRSGVLHREEVNIEFNRVQNITIKEPFYMRPFGLAVLSIDTAGSQGKEISLAGVNRARALELRETILGSARAATENIPGADTANGSPSGPKLLLALTRRDIIIYGLTANFMLWAAIAIGAFFSAGDVTEQFLGWLVNQFELEQVIETVESYGGIIALFLLGLSLLLLGLLLLPLISVIGAIFRYDGYRLSVEGETYRKSSGLLTKHDDSLKQHKIQALVWKQNAIARFFKRTNIQLRQTSAGTGMESGQFPVASKSNFLVPALHPEQADELSNEFLTGCQPDEVIYSAVDRRRFMVFKLAVILLPLTALTMIPGILASWKFFTVVPVVGGITFLILNRCWKKLGYGVSGEYGFVRHGFIGTYTTIFPLFKIQRVDVRQTPLQHRKGLGHLTIHLASHSVKVPYITMHDANRFRDLALYKVESSNRAWF